MYTETTPLEPQHDTTCVPWALGARTAKPPYAIIHSLQPRTPFAIVYVLLLFKWFVFLLCYLFYGCFPAP